MQGNMWVVHFFLVVWQGDNTCDAVALYLIHFSCTKKLENCLIVYRPPIIPGYGWRIILLPAEPQQLSSPPVRKKRLNFCISPCCLPSEHSHLFGVGMGPSVATPLILHLIQFSFCFQFVCLEPATARMVSRCWTQSMTPEEGKEKLPFKRNKSSYGESLLLTASQVKKGKEGR